MISSFTDYLFVHSDAQITYDAYSIYHQARHRINEAGEYAVVASDGLVQYYHSCKSTRYTMAEEYLFYERNFKAAEPSVKSLPFEDDDFLCSHTNFTAEEADLLAKQSIELILGESSVLSPCLLYRYSMAGGCVYDLDKEAMRSGMPVRFALCTAALYFLLAVLRRLTAMTLSRVSAFRSDMRLEYARVLAPKLTGDLLILAAGFALTIGALGGLVWFLLQPVYVFPEWIPAVQVEWEDINTTFWNLTREAAKPIRCLTQEMIRIEFWTRIAHWGLMAALFGWAAMMTDGRNRTE